MLKPAVYVIAIRHFDQNACRNLNVVAHPQDGIERLKRVLSKLSGKRVARSLNFCEQLFCSAARSAQNTYCASPVVYRFLRQTGSEYCLPLQRNPESEPNRAHRGPRRMLLTPAQQVQSCACQLSHRATFQPLKPQVHAEARRHSGEHRRDCLDDFPDVSPTIHKTQRSDPARPGPSRPLLADRIPLTLSYGIKGPGGGQ